MITDNHGLSILIPSGFSEEGIRLAELADHLALKKTTVYNLARTLQARGCLARDPPETMAANGGFDESKPRYWGSRAEYIRQQQ